MASVTQQMGATAWWNAGFTGRGIDVAVIDSGVSPVEGLNAAGKVVHGADLSLESQAPNLRYLDTFGHGTFMAGVIAGRGSGLTTPYANAPSSAYRGVAPDARIVSLKVATADGGTDVSQVIAAINWVIQHRNDNGMNIRVLNLSYGTNATQSPDVDPLSYAVEQAWKKGIVVVVAAGNAGYTRGATSPCLANPGRNPWVITVGGVDTMGTATMADDVIGTYSSTGAGGGCKSPDFVAPGSHFQGLRVPNGFIDAQFPAGQLGSLYFRGTGTSQAAALTSGAVALILQKYPGLTPDQVKRFFIDSAVQVSSANGFEQGNGQINLGAMLNKSPAKSTQKLTNGTGTGSLDLARGTDRLTANGVTLNGERDVFGRPFDSAAMAAATKAGTAWSGGTWNGSTWTGSTWTGSTWTGSSFSGSTWTGGAWAGGSWS